MKIGQTIQNTRKTVVSLLVLILIGLIIFWLGGFFLGKPVEPKISSTLIQNELQNMSELVTTDYQYSNVGKYENSLDINGWEIPLSQKSFLLTYRGEIMIGVDLEQAKIEVDDQTINVHLPAVKVLSNTIDEESIEVYDESTNLFNPIHISDYTEFASQQKKMAEKEAVEKGLLEEAQQSTIQSITKILNVIPEVKENFTINITIEESK